MGTESKTRKKSELHVNSLDGRGVYFARGSAEYVAYNLDNSVTYNSVCVV